MLRAMMIIGGFAFLVGLVIYALIDCIRTESYRLRALPKPLWALAIILFPVLGALLWLLLGKTARSSFGAPPTSSPRAPDDDPDYLRFLEAKMRRQAQEHRQEEDGEGEEEQPS